MKKQSGLPVFIVLVSLCVPSMASAGGYAGFNLIYGTYKDSEIKLNPTMAAVRLGYGVSDNFAIEARLGYGISDDNFTVDLGGGPPLRIDLGVKEFVSVYAKGILPVGEVFALYGLLGYSHGKLEASSPGLGSFSETDNGLSYGVGGEYYVTPRTTIGFEWARLIDGSFEGESYNIDGISVGVRWHFGLRRW